MVLQLVERIRPHHKHSIARKSHLNCIAAYFIARKLDFAGFGITGHKVGRKLFFLLRGQFLEAAFGGVLWRGRLSFFVNMDILYNSERPYQN